MNWRRVAVSWVAVLLSVSACQPAGEDPRATPSLTASDASSALKARVTGCSFVNEHLQLILDVDVAREPSSLGELRVSAASLIPYRGTAEIPVGARNSGTDSPLDAVQMSLTVPELPDRVVLEKLSLYTAETTLLESADLMGLLDTDASTRLGQIDVVDVTTSKGRVTVSMELRPIRPFPGYQQGPPLEARLHIGGREVKSSFANLTRASADALRLDEEFHLDTSHGNVRLVMERWQLVAPTPIDIPMPRDCDG